MTVAQPQESFGRRLTRMMSHKGVTIRKAAQIAGVSPSTIHSWRISAAPTDFRAVKRLAEFLGTTLAFLLIGEDENISGAGEKKSNLNCMKIMLTNHLELTGEITREEEGCFWIKLHQPVMVGKELPVAWIGIQEIVQMNSSI